MNHEFRLMIQKYIEQRLEGERMNALRNLLQAITFPTALFKIREKQRELLAQAEIYQHEQQKGAFTTKKSKTMESENLMAQEMIIVQRLLRTKRNICRNVIYRVEVKKIQN